MTPYLVKPPAEMPVPLADMRDYRRLLGFEDDDLTLEALQSAAVAHLDGHGGILGRCIMPQEWALDVTGPGGHVLPFPDASGVAVDFGAVATRLSAAGVVATVSGVDADQAVTITAEYGLPVQRLPAAQQLVRLLVGGWFEYREAVSEKNMAALPFGVTALISGLRWGGL